MAGSGKPSLPPRVDTEFARLLKELAVSGHEASGLLGQTRLPAWCRRPLFFFLGYIARADGRVTETDIRYTEALINALDLSVRQRRKAIASFQRGKTVDDLPALRGLWLRLSHRIWPGPALLVAICLCHAAQLFGRPGKPRRYRCEDAIDRIGLPMLVCDDIFSSYACKVWVHQTDPLATPVNFEQACELLGVTRRDSLDDIKRAYRKKVSACHPDKLAQRQLQADEQAIAKERLLRYQQAWELIKRRYRADDG